MHAQIAADTIGVPYEWVTLDNSNTDSSPLCTGTFASRGTFVGGNAIARAAVETRNSLFDVAGEIMEVDPADLVSGDGFGGRRARRGRGARSRRSRWRATWQRGRMIGGQATT